jgi:hypothetical protein
MDMNEIDAKVEELFEPFEEFAYPLSLDDALSLAEAMEDRFSNYADAIRDDIRNKR